MKRLVYLSLPLLLLPAPGMGMSDTDTAARPTLFFDHEGRRERTGEWLVGCCAVDLHGDGERRWADYEDLRREWAVAAPRVQSALAEIGYAAIIEPGIVWAGRADDGDAYWENRMTFTFPAPTADEFVKALRVAGATRAAEAFVVERVGWDETDRLGRLLARGGCDSPPSIR